MTILSQIISQDDMIRITNEFHRLKDRCYLETAGTALYPQSLILNIQQDFLNNVYMNPHTDKCTRDSIDQIRGLILHHFNTDQTEYSVIFTSGTTHSLKLVLEAFEFTQKKDDDSQKQGTFIYLEDSHTSVVGLREIALENNANVIHISHAEFLKSIDNGKYNESKIESHGNDNNTLFAYSAQNNFNGFKYPIDCIDKIRNGCLNNFIKKQLCEVNKNCYVLLDAASFVPTNKLDLSKIQPDFVCLSFYKMFGYPTGLGALIVKNSSSHVLSQKTYFGGGTVDLVLSTEDFHVKRSNLHERFEDGTVPFLSIIALKHCFDTLNEIIPKVINHDVMDTITHHTFLLAKDLYYQLRNLEHPNGRKAVILFMDSDFTNLKNQGNTVTFSLIRQDGSHIGYSEFQNMADLFNISIRTGCFCNSGSCQRHLKVSNKELKEMFKAGHKCGDDIDLIDGKPTGCVRASFGYYNTFKDVDSLILMICRCFVKIHFEPHYRNITQNTDHILSPKVIEKTVYIKDRSFDDIQKIEVKPPLSKSYLKEISVFPVKSCGAFKVNTAWKMGRKGFEYDREWMIVKDNGACLTQKHNSKMCMIHPRIDLKKKVLVLSFKGLSSISIPLDVKNNMEKTATLCQSKICTDNVKGYDCGDQVADWISEALEVSYLRLIRQSEDNGRSKKEKNEVVKSKVLSFSNQAQYLLINKATVQWLASNIHDSSFTDNISDLTDRFRGNIVIETEKELEEMEWQRLVIGNQEFKVEGQCQRCQMVCIDQNTGEKTVEPLRTIAEQFGGKLRFGIYLTYVGPIDKSGDNILKVHSSVEPFNDEDDEQLLPV